MVNNDDQWKYSTGAKLGDRQFNNADNPNRNKA